MEILYLILGFLLLPWFLVTTITFLAGVSFWLRLYPVTASCVRGLIWGASEVQGRPVARSL